MACPRQPPPLRDHGPMVAISLPTWLQVGSTAAAAIAAVAAGITAVMSWRALRQSRLPLLPGEAVIIGGLGNPGPPPTMAITILNGGGGLAKGVAFVLVAGTSYCAGRAGFLLPGQQANFATDLLGDEKARAVV